MFASFYMAGKYPDQIFRSSEICKNTNHLLFFWSKMFFYEFTFCLLSGILNNNAFFKNDRNENNL